MGCLLFLYEHREMEKQYRTNYPSDVSDEEWAFVAPYLTLCREDAPQREHSLRAVFNGLRVLSNDAFRPTRVSRLVCLNERVGDLH